MCTAICVRGARHFFGRTLDVSCAHGEQLVLAPRGFVLHFRNGESYPYHPAMLGAGIATPEGVLYFDAMNEAGLCCAALNFPHSAVYHAPQAGKCAVSSFELIPYLLARCTSVREARALLCECVVTAESVSEKLPASPLHWLLADREEAIAVESVEQGLQIHEDPYGVLTNEPPFLYHTARLADLMGLSAAMPENRLFPQAPLLPRSGGIGAMGLPGDASSASRFVRAAFALGQGAGDGEIGDFFHVLDGVCVPRGCVRVNDGALHYTAYSCCMDMDTPGYYFTTHGCRRIRALRLAGALCEGRETRCFPMKMGEDVCFLDGADLDSARRA